MAIEALPEQAQAGSGDRDLQDALVSWYYPAIDMVMLGSIAAFAALTGGRLGRVWVLITAAVVCTAVGDAWFARLVAERLPETARIDTLPLSA